jgi:hypothetical protein
MAIAPDSSPGPRLRALKRLIEYAVVESEDLGQPLLGTFLGAAALVTGEELKRLEQDAGGRRVERKLNDGPEQIPRWRMKAEEIRMAAEGFGDGSARRHLLSSADTYDAPTTPRRGSSAEKIASQKRVDSRDTETRLSAPPHRNTAPRPA